MRRRILVVDDEDVLRELMRRWLTRAGHEVIEADCVAGGIAMIEGAREAIDLVVTDLRMPGGDGSRLIAWTRRSLPGLPILCVTGFAEEAPPGVPVLEKPVTAAQLVAKVTELLEARYGADADLAPGIKVASASESGGQVTAWKDTTPK